MKQQASHHHLIEFVIQIVAICFSIAATSFVEKKIEQKKTWQQIRESLQVISEDLSADAEGIAAINQYVNNLKIASNYLIKFSYGKLETVNKDSVCIYSSMLMDDRPAHTNVSYLSLLSQSMTTAISDPSFLIRISDAYTDFESAALRYNNSFNVPKMEFVRNIQSSSNGQSYPGEEVFDYYCRVFKSEQGKALLQFVISVNIERRLQLEINSIKEKSSEIDNYIKSLMSRQGMFNYL